jgi:dipeptidyl aminopeptidase/acylaminoacyl peptidase
MLLVFLVVATSVAAGEPFTLLDVARTRTVGSVAMAPDGRTVAYVLNVPRDPYDRDDGPEWAELHVAGPQPGQSRPFLTGEVNVSRIAWTPDGSAISFLAKRHGDEHAALWSIPGDGGEARRVVTHETEIEAYAWSPDGARVAFLAKEAEDDEVVDLRERGFTAEVFEEDWRPVKVWIATSDGEGAPRALELPGSASELHWSPDGGQLAVALAPTSLIDDEYMKRKLHVVEVASGGIVATVDNPGKLGKVAWSPDGKRLAFISGVDIHDPDENRLMIVGSEGGAPRDWLHGFEGDVKDIAWIDERTLAYVRHEGVEAAYATVDVVNARRTIVGPGGPILRSVRLSADGKRAGFTADAPGHPTEVWVLSDGDTPVRWTDSNPWMKDRDLARQEVVTYQARDGLAIEGILLHPIGEKKGQRYPLVMIVHGGPESHHSNGWMTRYSRPGQVLAAAGYAVFYPNYRGSTGRGVEFATASQGDYGGAEWDDLVDAIEHLNGIGLVDPEKVGVTGGSYGGFATAWCATRLTEHFAAGVMFVGISEQTVFAGTSDIPNELYLVHARSWPWEKRDWYRERSPLRWVEQARTPLLIMGGTDDTRVDPSQSLILYRFLKILGNVPVRYVRYPGEGHGNRMAAARLDYGMRLVRWMDHYLKGPGGDPPDPRLEHP